MEPWNIRPNRDWAVVRRDKRKTTMSCGLYFPVELNHEQLHEGSGFIVRIGVGPIAKSEELSSGQRILYRSYLKDIHPLPTGQRWEDGELQEFALISLKDVLAQLDPDVEVGLLSERKS